MNPYEYNKMAAVESDHWWFRGRREILAQVIARLELGPKPMILEAGCGTGGNLSMLSTFGEVCAFDISTDARAIARQRAPGVDICSGHLPDAVPFQGRTFDLICLFDVLEHIENDIDALWGLKDLLAPDGHILLTVPAFPALWSQHDSDLHHHRRYTRSGLIDTLARADLSIVWISYFNTLLFPLALISRWVARLFHIKPAGNDLPPPLINRALHSIFSAERHWIYPRKLPFGVSLIALAQR